MIPNLSNQQHRDSIKSKPTQLHQMTFLKQQLQRKPSNYLLTSNKTHKNNTTDSFKYMITVPIKSDITNSTTSLHNPKVKSVICMEEIKTERKENKVQGHRLNKKNSEGQADYYKYWKKKASQYQSQNFDLHKTNSLLQSQNQNLKFKIEKLQKKIESLNLSQHPKKGRPQENTDRLENIFRIKVDQLIKKISDKEILIQKLTQKINDLSNEVSENSRMKSVIDNMQQRFSEIKSSCGSVNDSASNYGYDQSELKQKDKDLKKKYSDFQNPNINNACLKKTMNHTSSYFSISTKQWD